MMEKGVVKQLMRRITIAFPGEGVGAGRGNLKSSLGDISLVMGIKDLFGLLSILQGELGEAEDTLEGLRSDQGAVLDGEGEGGEGVEDPSLVVVEEDLELGGSLGERGGGLAVDGEEGVLGEDGWGQVVVQRGDVGHSSH